MGLELEKFSKGLKVALVGGTGRMGLGLAKLIINKEMFKGVLESPDNTFVGRDISEVLKEKDGRTYPSKGVVVESDWERATKDANMVVDFSAPEATMKCLALASKSPKYKNIHYLIGTTGFSEKEDKQITEYGKQFPIMQSANYSVGIHCLKQLVQKLSGLLKTWDVDIVERHHNQKKDSPSGTALMLSKAVADARGWDSKKVLRMDRSQSLEPRGYNKKEIGMSSLRLGGVVGEHKVYISSEFEELVLSHTAFDRMAFYDGVLRAATWLYGQAPGRYSMSDVFPLL